MVTNVGESSKIRLPHLFHWVANIRRRYELIIIIDGFVMVSIQWLSTEDPVEKMEMISLRYGSQAAKLAILHKSESVVCSISSVLVQYLNSNICA